MNRAICLFRQLNDMCLNKQLCVCVISDVMLTHSEIHLVSEVEIIFSEVCKQV
ncbi:MAG: hypothetical protein IJ358_03065 [Clostridia bacterium]|nr:hypothetical protein [Clostridia bacterium]